MRQKLLGALLLGVVDELMCHYDIEISVEDLIPENFNSAEAIYALVQRLKDEE